MRAATYLYPWDIVGDPDAPRRIADLGVEQVTLASAYHSTRALTPRHPRHRIVTAPHAAVLYRPDPARWTGRALRPYPQTWIPCADPYAEAAEALAAAGLCVHSWVVLAHNSRLGGEFPRTSVTNAYGDRYPWAPCIAQPGFRAYATALAAEAAVRPGTDGTELESAGWYGVAHLHAHDKIGGVSLPGAAQYLMSLCFCDTCQDGYASLGLDADDLQLAVRAALAPIWSGEYAPAPGAPADRTAEWAEVERLLGTDLAAATLAHRTEVASTLQRDLVAAVRAEAADPAFRVLLHADPAPHRAGANAGVDPAGILAHADGLVLPCTGAPDALIPFAAHRRPGTTLAANLGIVTGMGGTPHTLVADAARAAALGATELRLYHAGPACEADLAAVREALAELRRPSP
ncbi:hypothetical protein [Actinacidiphila oryziradicis]|uniref:hypothetical protein n=1 Tax=Actinacidiphila oryziradicis TaxID=2571141 RepID=UPI0023F05A84|nr:hypothetical protein [Actinacidiphila oryziradicis]MCW2870386.1 putative alanine-rich protein [Actinacidiphila oryziradicis]